MAYPDSYPYSLVDYVTRDSYTKARAMDVTRLLRTQVLPPNPFMLKAKEIQPQGWMNQFDVDLISIRHERVGSMSNRRRSDVSCYPGRDADN